MSDSGGSCALRGGRLPVAHFALPGGGGGWPATAPAPWQLCVSVDLAIATCEPGGRGKGGGRTGGGQASFPLRHAAARRPHRSPQWGGLGWKCGRPQHPLSCRMPPCTPGRGHPRSQLHASAPLAPVPLPHPGLVNAVLHLIAAAVAAAALLQDLRGGLPLVGVPLGGGAVRAQAPAPAPALPLRAGLADAQVHVVVVAAPAAAAAAGAAGGAKTPPPGERQLVRDMAGSTPAGGVSPPAPGAAAGEVAAAAAHGGCGIAPTDAWPGGVGGRAPHLGDTAACGGARLRGTPPPASQLPSSCGMAVKQLVEPVT